MSEKKVMKPIALAVGAALAGTFALAGPAAAGGVDNPFEITDLRAGYMLGESEGACGGSKEDKGEGACGGDKEGEGSCGGSGDKEGEGSCGESGDKEGEGSCGEGSCGSET